MNIIPKRALISVSDKTGLDTLAPILVNCGIEVISTGGTADYLQKLGVKITPIQEVTGNPEAFGGRMKSISFQVCSGLLYRRDHEQDKREAKDLNIKDIDLVICNLYPFKEVSKKKNVNREELIENIDIGGPNMIRAAAKNMKWVTVVTDPQDYGALGTLLTAGGTSLADRSRFALKAFSLTAQYDLAISLKLAQEFEDEMPNALSHEVKPLRYGENPHQKAKLFVLNNKHSGETSLAEAPILQGKEISYNNYLDADQAFKCVSELHQKIQDRQHCVIVKHGIPCGVASAKTQQKSLEAAWSCDPISAFGGIIAFSQEVSVETAAWLNQYFIEVVIAPSYTPEALSEFGKKKNVRLVQVPMKKEKSHEWTLRSINGGVLWQDEDEKLELLFKPVTKKTFTQRSDLMAFGMVVTKYLKSNCLLLADERDGAMVTLASGVGQPNRLECLTLLAGPRMKTRGLEVGDAILFSDAFFPFRDSIEEANRWGIKNIVQPGGSIKDQEVIGACDEFGIAMAFSGERHFRH